MSILNIYNMNNLQLLSFRSNLESLVSSIKHDIVGSEEDISIDLQVIPAIALNTSIAVGGIHVSKSYLISRDFSHEVCAQSNSKVRKSC